MWIMSGQISADATALAAGAGWRGGRRWTLPSMPTSSGNAGGAGDLLRRQPSAPPSPDRATVITRSHPNHHPAWGDAGDDRRALPPTPALDDAGTLPLTSPASDNAHGRLKVPHARVERERRLITTPKIVPVSLSHSPTRERCLATYLPRYEKSWLGVDPKIWYQRLGRFYAQTANKKSGSFFDHLNDFWSYGSP